MLSSLSAFVLLLRMEENSDLDLELSLGMFVLPVLASNLNLA